MQNRVIIIGNGKLARLVIEKLGTYIKKSFSVEQYKSNNIIHKNDILVHLGSGREYHETIKIAEKFGNIYIQAATEKTIPLHHPKSDKLKFIHAPNLDLKIIKLFYILKNIGSIFQKDIISITESHQSSKTSLPGTAVKIAKQLDVNTQDIISIRDEETQKRLGIKNTQQHAYHQIKIGDEQSNISFETKIEGGDSYIKGLSQIIQASIKIHQNGNYEVEQLFELGLL